MNEFEKIKIIEEVLLEMYINDDSHVVDTIVNQIRDKFGDKTFALGAAFKDEE